MSSRWPRRASLVAPNPGFPTCRRRIRTALVACGRPGGHKTLPYGVFRDWLPSVTPWHTRVRQVWAGLRPSPDPDEAGFTARWLTPRTRPVFDRLAIHDRRHLVAVARELEHLDLDNDDLIVAGLLHDIGKANDRDQVTLVDRILRVFLGRVAPGFLERFARPNGIGIRRRLYLALHHARLGAVLAEQNGCSERTVWLIKNHDVSDPTDPDLRRLAEIDRATP